MNKKKNECFSCELYGFHCGVDEASILLGYDTMSLSNWFPILGQNLIFMGQNVPEKFYLDVEMMHGNKPGDKKKEKERKKGVATFLGVILL